MSDAPTCVFVNTYYQAFIEHHYSQNPDLAKRRYDDQHASLTATRFGDSDFYSQGLKYHGWQTVDLIANVPPLQAAWAAENQPATAQSSARRR